MVAEDNLYVGGQRCSTSVSLEGKPQKPIKQSRDLPGR
jgi:hypothetical protein